MAIKQMGHMFLSLYFVLLLTALTASSPVYNTSPVKDMAKKETPNSISDTLKSSLERVQTSLSSWQEYFRKQLHLADDDLHHLHKRHTENNYTDSANISENITTTETPGNSFEDYEKEYYINKTMNLLRQMLCFNEYKESLKDDSPTAAEPSISRACGASDGGNRVDRILDRKLRELNDMAVSQLDRLFHSVKSSARSGTVDTSISRLCCNVG